MSNIAIVKRYEELRQRYLACGGFTPEEKLSCSGVLFQSRILRNGGSEILMSETAALLDQLYSALNTAIKIMEQTESLINEAPDLRDAKFTASHLSNITRLFKGTL